VLTSWPNQFKVTSNHHSLQLRKESSIYPHIYRWGCYAVGQKLLSFHSENVSCTRLVTDHLSIFLYIYIKLFVHCASLRYFQVFPSQEKSNLAHQMSKIEAGQKKRIYILASHILHIFACTILPFKTQVESDETQDETATWMQEVNLCKLSHFGFMYVHGPSEAFEGCQSLMQGSERECAWMEKLGGWLKKKAVL